MQTEHRHLCVYRKGNSVCISFRYQLTLFMKLYPAYCMQKASSRAAQAEPTDVIILTVGSEALALCSECMHVMKKKNHAAEMCSSVHTRFIIGLPNI